MPIAQTLGIMVFIEVLPKRGLGRQRADRAAQTGNPQTRCAIPGTRRPKMRKVTSQRRLSPSPACELQGRGFMEIPFGVAV